MVPSNDKKRPARNRAAARSERRRQLIEATMDSIAKRGFSETTLASVAEGAGLSAGVVNFHFLSKDALLTETLRHLSEQYRTRWLAAIESAGSDAAQQLEALVRVDFEPPVCTRKWIAVWSAFYGEARSRPTYLAVCEERDRAYEDAALGLCRRIAEEGGYRGLDPQQVSDGIQAMTEGLWIDCLITPERFDRENARRTVMAYLEAAFPRHFPIERVNG